MSKHAATGRTNQAGAPTGTGAGEAPRRRSRGAVGRHRARPARWAALARAVRSALSSRSRRVSMAARCGGWGRTGGSEGWRRSPLPGRGAAFGRQGQWVAADRWMIGWGRGYGRGGGILAAVGVLAVSAPAVLRGVGRPGRSGALGDVLGGVVRRWSQPRDGAEVVRQALRRSCAALRRSVARASCRARTLGIQWTVQARTRAEAGMSTAEYAVGTIAACGFAALLWKVVTSAEVRSMLAALIQKALKLAA
ncbi:DUF4244 domain-containing protein [Microbispora sp. H11081]|uniref:DUF4244 domain-containing protein n=1 Tax=Microbispora sp. H11081 TaxID=2729107 RepID=UPI0020163DED|nr:DUF4244 domain-containing protein [Microbispora sp. H11081]